MNSIDKAREIELFQYGLTPQEAGVLFFIKTIGSKATPSEILRWLFREPHSTAGLIKRMENKGLVRTAKDLERKNLVRVVITKKGLEAYKHSIKRESIHNIR